MPRRMVLCARPVAALTAVIPPRPSETASTAAQRRRPRSVNSSARPWYLVSIHRMIRWSIMREIVTNSPHRSQCRVRAINYARRLRITGDHAITDPLGPGNMLLPVENRGTRYDPPAEHLGQKLTSKDPL